MLIPWPNRIEDGSYEFEGRRHQLALTEPEHRNAIHGLVCWAAWRVQVREAGRVVLKHQLHPSPGYPFALALTVEYELSKRGLAVRTTATNVGADSCPYGAGAHPYLTVGTPTVDSVTLRVPGRVVLHSDDRGLPSGTEGVDGTEYDFRRPRQIASTVLDNAYTDLERDEDGRARVGLRAPGGVGVTLWADEGYPYLMLFTRDPLPDVNRRSIAVEPMTCPPNAFRSGEGVIRLEPGRRHSAAWGIDTGAISSPLDDVQPVQPLH